MLVPIPDSNFQMTWSHSMPEMCEGNPSALRNMSCTSVRLVSGGLLFLFDEFRKNVVCGLYFADYDPEDGFTVSVDTGLCKLECLPGNSMHLLFLEPKGDNKKIFGYRNQITPFARFRDQAIFSIFKGTCKDIGIVKSTEEVLVAESRKTGVNGSKRNAIIVLERSRLKEIFKEKQFTPEYASGLVSTELQRDMLAIMGRLLEENTESS